MTEDIHAVIADNRKQGKSFVLATIIKIAGHTPRDVGARMLVYPDGSIYGTIGGGNFEKSIIEDCLSLLNGNSEHLLKTYKFQGTGDDSTGMLCGGEAQVFMEVFAKPDTLLIFGGGHVGGALAEVAARLEFKIIIVDSRPNILESYRLPVQTILTDENYDDNIPEIGPESYVVIVTHGHKHDQKILSRVIKDDCAYIGMIGSPRKIAATFSALEQEGIDKALFDKVHAPIGLDIGAEGPQEIAVAIAAELIAVRKKRSEK